MGGTKEKTSEIGGTRGEIWVGLRNRQVRGVKGNEI